MDGWCIYRDKYLGYRVNGLVDGYGAHNWKEGDADRLLYLNFSATTLIGAWKIRLRCL